MKGYTVFSVEQIDGLPEPYYSRPAPRFEPLPRIAHAESFFAATCADIRHGGNEAYYAIGPDYIQMPPYEAFENPKRITPPSRMNARTGRAIPRGSTAVLTRSAGAMTVTPPKNS